MTITTRAQLSGTIPSSATRAHGWRRGERPVPGALGGRRAGSPTAVSVALRVSAIGLLAASVCSPTVAAAAGRPPSSLRVVVAFKQALSAAAARALAGDVGGRLVSSIPVLRARVIEVPRSGASTALATLRAKPDVAYAQVDGTIKPADHLPNDPFFPQAFSLNGGAWGWTATRTTQAWDVTEGTPSTVIAVVDTGLQNVADLSGQSVSGWNVLNSTSDTSTGAGNHGTYVAGVAGLGADNGEGNVGYCPGCRIMPILAGTDSGASDANLAAGVTWAADHGARVINLSWAGSGSSSVLASAIAYAESKGDVVVAAAGNSNCNCPTYPASYPGVVSVAGTSSTGAKAGDSNYGSWVSVAAPESNLTAWPTYNGAPGYAPLGGTSLAAPVVSAIAGLLFSYDPAATAAQVEHAIESTATPVPFGVASGQVDALGALEALGAIDPQPATPPVDTVAPSVLALSSTGADTSPLGAAPYVGQVLARDQGSWSGAAPLGLHQVLWERCDPTGSSCVPVVSSATYTVQSADVGMTLRVAITVSNGLGSATQTSAPTGIVTTSAPPPPPPPPPTPPTNSAPPAISGTPQAGSTLTSSTGSWSGSPTSYAYQWARCATGGSCAAIAGATGSAYTAATADEGSTLEVTVTASNAGGSAAATSQPTGVVQPGYVTQTFTGSINSRAPSASFVVSVAAGAQQEQLSFSTRCTALTLAVQSGGAVLGQSSGPSVIARSDALAAGSYTFLVSGSCKTSFTLTVKTPS